MRPPRCGDAITALASWRRRGSWRWPTAAGLGDFQVLGRAGLRPIGVGMRIAGEVGARLELVGERVELLDSAGERQRLCRRDVDRTKPTQHD